VFSQTPSLDSIPSSVISIELPPAEHWRVVMPGELFDRATSHLVRAEGCYLELSESQKETKALRNQVVELETKAAALATIDTLSQKIAENTKTLTKKEKRKAWFKNAKKDIIITLLSVVASAEAAFILYEGLK